MVPGQRGESTASKLALLTRPREESADSQPAGSPIAAARQEVRQLLDLAQVLGSSLSLDETLSSVALRVRRMLPYDSIAVYIRRQDHLEAEYASGENSPFFGSLKIPIGQGISGWVAEHRTPVLNGDPASESSDKAPRTGPLHSALAVPLEGLNGVVGVLAVYAREKDAFTNDHLRILSAVTTKVALSIENALKYRRAQVSATTDALTGLPNSRALFLQLEAELARAGRQNQPLALLMCDLDRFKQINDQFGHLGGNRVLSAVGRALKLQCREYDYVARMGGDEFVIVLSGYHSETVAAKVEQFSRAVAEAGRDTLGVGTLGVSIGVACYPSDGQTVESLMVEADRRMYSVKPLGDRAHSVVPM